MVRRRPRRRGRWAALLLVALSLGWAAAQPAVDAWPRPAERPLVGEPAWLHPEGRERLLQELVALFRTHYWDVAHVDWAEWGGRHRVAVVAAEDRGALDAAFGRMVRELGDDHSSWLGLPGGTDASERETTATPRLGVQLSYVNGRGLVVERVFPGTPAAEADLRRADVITSVGDLDLRSAGSLFEANAALAAALGEGSAALRVERGRVAFEVEIAASTVAWSEVASRPYAVMLGEDVGYLHVPTFNEAGVGLAVHRALQDLASDGARSLVLDLRGNLGGRLVEAGLVAGAFLEGTWARATARGEFAWSATYGVEPAPNGGLQAVSRLVQPDGAVIGEARVAEPASFAGPIVVVVGSETASAGEIVAGALLAGGRARVVGETTQGNVEAIRAYALSDGSRVLVAIARVEATDGAALDAGVAPEVTARASVLDLARGVDPPVAEALRLLGRLPFTPGRWF
jgi:carboxyl-terminal processing protease